MEELTNSSGHDESNELARPRRGLTSMKLSHGYDRERIPFWDGRIGCCTGAVGTVQPQTCGVRTRTLQRWSQRNVTIPSAHLLWTYTIWFPSRTPVAISAHDMSNGAGNGRLSMTTGRRRFFRLSSRVAQGGHPGEYVILLDAANVDFIFPEGEPVRQRPSRPDLTCSSECATS